MVYFFCYLNANNVTIYHICIMHIIAVSYLYFIYKVYYCYLYIAILYYV